MIGEQTVTCRYKSAGPQDTDIEIQMTVQIETPADPYADVSIEPHFGSIFPEDQDDGLYQRLYHGVHGGISLSGGALAPNSIVVRILELRLSPCGITETLLRSMENLRSGKESYYEG